MGYLKHKMEELTNPFSFFFFFVSSSAVAGNIRAIFTFGDSIFDAGNNHFNPNCSIQADFPPYGRTGRFTNGRTVIDFVSELLGVELQKPYLEVELEIAKGILNKYPVNGINFASVGSGVLNDTTFSLFNTLLSYLMIPNSQKPGAIPSEGYSNVLSACCGDGTLRGMGQCGVGEYTVCDRPDEFLFWDFFHPTGHTYSLLTKAFWTGNQKKIRPRNLQTLANTTL
ncbi:GDSL esterase/lipase 6-like [Aristolochia californica]|uniref:GDSL esterase/lipase 6-like n=1 Tax=Aristolochia californica TaxID=171875 RepID=UPI0035D8A47E